MFGRTKVFSSYSVDDIAAARKFYSEVLGLSVSDQAESLMLHSGDQTVLIYAKPNHTPATFTVLNFDVGDIDNAVNELTAQGVRMERYEESTQTNGGSTTETDVRSHGSQTPPATFSPSCSSSESSPVRSGSR
jgi:predicted enzyme related to lactoylglutathione lyase